MCGIAGFICSQPLPRNTARALSEALLWYSAERGQQSAGIYVNGRTLKRAIDPGSFIELSAFHNLFDKPPTVALLHTRQPTCGGLGDAQAQPFQRGGTVTIHNGMVWECSEVKAQWGIKKPSGVDSELICSFVAKLGGERLPEFLESSYTLSAVAAWHQQKLYLMRDGNPTSYTFLNLADGSRLFAFASTEGILEAALGHCWLLPSGLNIQSTSDGQLYHATPAALTPIGKPIKSGFSHLPYGASLGKRYYGGEDWWEREAAEIHKKEGHLDKSIWTPQNQKHGKKHYSLNHPQKHPKN